MIISDVAFDVRSIDGKLKITHEERSYVYLKIGDNEFICKILPSKMDICDREDTRPGSSITIY